MNDLNEALKQIIGEEVDFALGDINAKYKKINQAITRLEKKLDDVGYRLTELLFELNKPCILNADLQNWETKINRLFYHIWKAENTGSRQELDDYINDISLGKAKIEEWLRYIVERPGFPLYGKVIDIDGTEYNFLDKSDIVRFFNSAKIL